MTGSLDGYCYLINELWVRAEELEEFNERIVGTIEVTKEFNKQKQ